MAAAAAVASIARQHGHAQHSSCARCYVGGAYRKASHPRKTLLTRTKLSLGRKALSCSHAVCAHPGLSMHVGTGVPYVQRANLASSPSPSLRAHQRFFNLRDRALRRLALALDQFYQLVIIIACRLRHSSAQQLQQPTLPTVPTPARNVNVPVAMQAQVLGDDGAPLVLSCVSTAG